MPEKPMPNTLRATIARADPTRPDKPVPAGHIDITENTHYHLPEGATLAEHRVFWQSQARQIFDVLNGALPGGTLDALFAVMAADRASLLRVVSPTRDRRPATIEGWCVFVGGPDPDNAALTEVYDDEAEARAHLQWYDAGQTRGIARRDVVASGWTVLAVEGPLTDDGAETAATGEPCEVCGSSPATRCRVEPNDPTDPGAMTLCAACAHDIDAEGVTR
jgi:hypothetical protein